MSATNTFNLLRSKDAILEVPMDGVKVLRPNDPKKAIGTRDLNGCTVLVVIGTGQNDGIIMAHIGPRAQPGMSSGSSSAGSPTQIKAPVTAGEKHFMRFVRTVTGIVLKERLSSADRSPFSSPVAFGIFGRFEQEVPLDHLREQVQQAFQHVNISIGHFTYEVMPREEARTAAKGTAVAVRMDAGGPELYVEDKLVYPSDNTCALALEMSRLGISDYEQNEGDEDDDNEEEDDDDDEEEDDEDEEEGDGGEGGDHDEETRDHSGQEDDKGQRHDAGQSSSPQFRWVRKVNKEYHKIDTRTSAVLSRQSNTPLNVVFLDEAENVQCYWNGSVLKAFRSGAWVPYQPSQPPRPSQHPSSVRSDQPGQSSSLQFRWVRKINKEYHKIDTRTSAVLSRQSNTPLNVVFLDEAENVQCYWNGSVLKTFRSGAWVQYQPSQHPHA